MLSVVEGTPLGQSFKDPAVEAGRTVTTLQPAAVRSTTDGTISPAWLSTSARKRKTDTRIGRSAPKARPLVHDVLFDEMEGRSDDDGSA